MHSVQASANAIQLRATLPAAKEVSSDTRGGTGGKLSPGILEERRSDVTIEHR
jgi:hypothetical protein